MQSTGFDGFRSDRRSAAIIDRLYPDRACGEVSTKDKGGRSGSLTLIDGDVAGDSPQVAGGTRYRRDGIRPRSSGTDVYRRVLSC